MGITMLTFNTLIFKCHPRTNGEERYSPKRHRFRTRFTLPVLSCGSQPHRGQCGSSQPHRAPKPDRQKQHHDEPYSRGKPWDWIAGPCICVNSRITAPGNSGVVGWWDAIVGHDPVLSVLLQAWECWRSDPSRSVVHHDTPAVEPDGPSKSRPYIEPAHGSAPDSAYFYPRESWEYRSFDTE